MDTPQVSVITIFLNAERFIEEAIESVLDQTCEVWELILVDDGSTDGSTAIAKQYARQHPARIRYVEHPGHANCGMSASRNLGICHARGTYIAFLDADDVWLPRRLAVHVGLLERRPRAAMVYGPTLYWHSWTDRPQRLDTVGDVGVPAETLFEPPYLLRRFLESGGGILPGICSLLVRRSVVGQVGGFEETFRGAYEDQVFLSKVCLRHPVYVTDVCLDYYRQHSDSACHRAMASGEYHPEQPHPARERYLDWLAGYLIEHGAKNPGVWAALRQELWPYRHPLLHRLDRWRQRGPVKHRAKRALRRALPAGAYRWLRQQVPG